MRVLLIGNTNRRHLAKRYYRFDHRIHNGLVRAGHHVYFFCDREESRHSRIPFKFRESSTVRRRLHAVMRHFRPQAIIITHTKIVTVDMLLELRAAYPDVRIGQFSVDALFSPKNRAGMLSRQDAVHGSFVNTSGPALREMTGNKSPFYFVPNMTDNCIDDGTAHLRDELPYDVCCFMNGSHNEPGDQKQRIDMALGLQRELPHLRYHYRGFNGTRGLEGCDYIEGTGSAAMGLNLSRYQLDGVVSTPELRYLYSSSRIGHIMGNGSLAMVQGDFSLQDLYSDKEVVFFDGLEDLKEKTAFYAANPAARRKIASAGWKKAHEQFNTALIMQYVLDRICDQPLSHDYAWPTGERA